MSAPRIVSALALFALVALAVPTLGQGLTLDVLRAPDVVVASDFEGEERTTPRYLFSVEARITNGNTERTPAIHAVTYLDRSVEGCPEEPTGVRPVHLFAKNPQLARRETVSFGGATAQTPGDEDRYWPLEVFRKYPSPGGGTEANPPGEHGFCVVAIVSGNDPGCDKPQTQVCTLASAPFRAYVRHSNEPPEITRLEVLPERPRPGQEVLLRASAQDEDAVPKPDTVTYRWTVQGDTLHGSVQRVRFNTPGTHELTLTVTDGFEPVKRTLNVTVAGEPVTPPDGDENGAPLPAMLVVAGMGLAAAMRARGPVNFSRSNTGRGQRRAPPKTPKAPKFPKTLGSSGSSVSSGERWFGS